MKHMLVAFLVLATSSWGLAKESKEAEQLEKASFVVNEIMNTPDKSIPQDLLDKAVCVGVVPSELKFAIGIGGNYGRGVLVCRRGGNGAWGAPLLFTLGGGSFGFQLGGKATDIVFLVMNPGGVRKLLRDRVELGADIGAAAGPVGRSASGETDASMHAEILSYSRSRGLFAGMSLKGAVLKYDKEDNRRLYGQDYAPRQVLLSDSVPVPAAAKTLDATLAKFSPHGGTAYRTVSGE